MPAHQTQDPFSAIIIGSTGGIGAALAKTLHRNPALHQLTLINRRMDGQAESLSKATALMADPLAEESLSEALSKIQAETSAPLRLVISAVGTLHRENGIGPEKSWRNLSADNLAELFAVNTIAPALIAKHTLPLLPKTGKSVVALMSARVGSISDNRLGGWYSYRAAKAALNQIIKTASIELARRKPDAAIIGLHPGTVDTDLSKPFQGNVAEGKLFSPEQSAHYLLEVIDKVTADDSGQLLAWDGLPVPA